MPSKTVVVPSVTLTIDQLLDAIRQLEESELTQVASVVLERNQHASLAALMDRLAAHTPAGHLSDYELAAEVRSVREERASRAEACD